MATGMRRLNAMKHGKGIARLTLGELPKPLHRHTSNARKYRREIETFVYEVKGEVGLTDAHWIDMAATAEMHANVCRWLMNTKFDKLSPSDMVTCSREVVRAKERRNAAFEKLGLDRSDASVFDSLYVENQADESDTSAALPATSQQPDPATDTDSQTSTSQGEPRKRAKFVHRTVDEDEDD